MANRKNQKHSILNRNYSSLVDTLNSELSNKGIPGVIVGGAAVQLHQAYCNSNYGMEDFSKNALLKENLRRTGDIDLITQSDITQMTALFNGLSGIYPSKVVSPSESSGSAVAPIYENGDHRKKRSPASLLINYQTDSTAAKGGLHLIYDSIFDDALDISLNHKGSEILAKVISPEHLAVSKLLRTCEKDKIDLFELIKAYNKTDEPINSEEIRSILKVMNRSELYESFRNINDLFNYS
jgi:hypothetical protein|tara:strand:+ start:292 stop:1008 length:717 start_codon:yes stop_codon:yes gene_type:complete